MTIVCSGSLAFDRIMDFPGVFADHIIAEKIDMLNVCFLINKVTRYYGGTAGNISYSLSLMEEKPLVAATLGDDADGRDYMERLELLNLPTSGVYVAPGEMTAGATIATDLKTNQFTFFHPGAMNQPSKFDPSALPQPYDQHLAIVSPGNLSEMKNLCRQYRELGIKFIVDPGQQTPAFSGEELLEMIDGSFMLITNQYELELVKKQTGVELEDLFQYTQTVLTTLGEKGCQINLPGRGSQQVLAVPPREVVDPTGAGDAFRAGMLKALVKGFPVLSAARLGSAAASFCVESHGTQDHIFTLPELLTRHYRTFKELLEF